MLETTLPYSNVRYVRFLDNESKLLLATDTNVILYDIIGHAEISSFPQATSLYDTPSYDQSTKKYASSQAGSVHLIDIQNGSVKVMPVYQKISRIYQLSGEYLFNNLGFGLKHN